MAHTPEQYDKNMAVPPRWHAPASSRAMAFRMELAEAWRCAEAQDAHNVGDSESRRAATMTYGVDQLYWLALFYAIVDPKKRSAGFYVDAARFATYPEPLRKRLYMKAYHQRKREVAA